MIKPFLALVLVLFSFSSAQNCSIQFQKAVQFFESKQYNSAAEQFNRCLDLGVKNADIYYNLANSNHKAGKTALAILNYEKALKANPNHIDAAHNLAIAEAQKLDKQISIDRTSIIYKLLHFIPLNLSVQLSILTILTWITLVLFSRGRSDKVQFRLYALAVLTFIFTTPVVTTTAFRIYQNEFQEQAIVISPQIQVLTGPSKNSNLLTTLHAGYKVVVNETRQEWVKVQLDDSYGWVMKKSLGTI